MPILKLAAKPDPRNDLPAALRQLADKIEVGAVGPVNLAVLVLDLESPPEPWLIEVHCMSPHGAQPTEVGYLALGRAMRAVEEGIYE